MKTRPMMAAILFAVLFCALLQAETQPPTSSDQPKVKKSEEKSGKEMSRKSSAGLPDQRQVALECRVLLIDEQFIADSNDVMMSELKRTVMSWSVGRILSGPANDTVIGVLLKAQLPVVMDIPLQEETPLDDLQAGLLMKVTLKHRNSRQLTAPKAVVLPGESATMLVEDNISYIDTDGQKKKFAKGVCVVIQPNIEDDGQSICLTGYFRMTDVIGQETQVVDGREFSIPRVEIYETEFHRIVPDGATALVGRALTVAKTGTIAAEPTCANVQRLLVLIKPTIIKDHP